MDSEMHHHPSRGVFYKYGLVKAMTNATAVQPCSAYYFLQSGLVCAFGDALTEIHRKAQPVYDVCTLFHDHCSHDTHR